MVEDGVSPLMNAIGKSAELAANEIKNLKAENAKLNLQNGELREALQNMTGLFGEAVTRHQMGKAFGELHQEAVKSAKDALAKYTEKRKCVCGGVGLNVPCEPGCPNFR